MLKHTPSCSSVEGGGHTILFYWRGGGKALTQDGGKTHFNILLRRGKTLSYSTQEGDKTYFNIVFTKIQFNILLRRGKTDFMFFSEGGKTYFNVLLIRE